MKNVQKVIAFLVLMLTSASLFAQASKVLDRLPFEVIMDVVWQGQDIQIRKVLSCNMRKRLYPKDHPTGVDPGQKLALREVWDQDVSRIYHVFPSNEVLIIELPHVCGELKKSVDRLPGGYLPIIYWIDNADSPKEAEEIVSFRYFTENPHHRFAVRGFRIVETRHLANKIEDDERLVDLLRSRKPPEMYFAGVNAVAIPKSVWKQYSDLAAELGKYTESKLVDRDLVKRTTLFFSGLCESSAQGIGPAERCLTGPFDTRPYVIPAYLEDDVWRLKFDDVGARRYIWYVDAQKIDRTGCNPSFVSCNLWKGNYRLDLDKKTYEFSKSDHIFLFDIKRRLLVHVSFGIARSNSGRKEK